MKKIFSFLIIFSFLVVSTQSFAAKSVSLNWYKAASMMDANSRTLNDMDKTAVQAWKDYNDAVDRAKGIDTNSFNAYFTMLMVQQKELMPEQMKFAWEMSRDRRIVTKNTLALSLRSLFIGLYSSNADYKLKQKSLALAENINKQDKIKLKNSVISQLDLEESDYNLLKAQIDAESSKRSLDNINRNFNSFIGIDIDTVQDSIVYDEVYDINRLKSLDYYLQKALSTRLEILSAQKQLALDEKKKDIYDKNSQSLNYASAYKDYSNLVDSIESEKLKLEKLLLDVEQAMKKSYIEVVKTGNSLKGLARTLELQKRDFENMKLKYKKGYISKNTLDQMEIALDQVKLGYNTSLFNYNTSLMKLEYSAGIGPAY